MAHKYNISKCDLEILDIKESKANRDELDGKWGFMTYNDGALFSGSLSPGGSRTFDLSGLLPDDNREYECMFYTTLSTAANQSGFLYAQTDIMLNITPVWRGRSFNSTNVMAGGVTLRLPVGIGRTIELSLTSASSGKMDVSFALIGYRKCGG